MLLRRTATALLIVVATVGLAGACGGSSDDKATADNGVAAKTPDEILAAAKSALAAQKTYHLVGSGTQGGNPLAIDLSVDSVANNAEGSFTIKGTKLEIIVVGDTIYVKAPGSYYVENGAPQAAAQLLDGKWLKSPRSNPDFAEFASFTDADQLLDPDGEVTKGEETTFEGQAAVTLIDSAGTADEGTLYVRTTGDAVPLGLKSGGADSGTLTFKDFGATVAPTAPADAVDISQLGG